MEPKIPSDARICSIWHCTPTCGYSHACWHSFFVQYGATPQAADAMLALVYTNCGPCVMSHLYPDLRIAADNFGRLLAQNRTPMISFCRGSWMKSRFHWEIIVLWESQLCNDTDETCVARSLHICVFGFRKSIGKMAIILNKPCNGKEEFS